MFWTGRSRRNLGVATSWRRRAITLAALLAVFLQAFVVQTHIHAPVAPVAMSQMQPGDTVDASSHATAAGDHQIVCLLCQALATTSAATLATNAILDATLQTNTSTGIALALAPRAKSHSWRSRAPPSFL